MPQAAINPKRQEATRKQEEDVQIAIEGREMQRGSHEGFHSGYPQYVRRFKPTLTQEDLLELQKREEEGHAAFLLWKSEKDQQQKQKEGKEVEEELEKYHRILVDDELRSLRKDMTFQLWQMEKEAAEWKKTKSTEEDFEHREHLDVLEIGRKQIVDFKNVKRREGWNDSFPFGEMALAQGPLLTQLRTPRTSNTGEEGNYSLGISADGEVTLPVIQARDAATPSMIPHPDGLQSAPSEVQEAGGQAASAGEQVEESSQGDVHETAGGVAAAEVQNTVSAQEVEGMEGGPTPDAAEETEGEAAPEEVKEAGAAEDVEEEDVQEEVEETDGYAVSEDVEEEAASQKGSEQGI